MSRRFIYPCFALLLCVAIGCESAEVASDRPGARTPAEVTQNLVWPEPPAPARIRFLRSIATPADLGIKRGFFGTLLDVVTGKPAAHLVRPTGVAESGGAIYVADPGAQALWIFDARAQNAIEVRELGGARLTSPVAVTPGRDGRVFVADSVLDKVFIVDREGKPAGEIEDGALKRPVALAYDATNDTLYVLDAAANQIVAYGAGGKRIVSWGGRGNGDGEFNFPGYLALSPGGEVLVTDSLNYRVQAFDRTGKFLWKIGRQGDGSGDFAAPKGIASDADGHLYVVDALFDAVQIFDRNGELLLAFGDHGSAPGKFWLPCGTFIDHSDRIYVADSFNQRVQLFEFIRESSAANADGGVSQTARR